VCLVGVKSSKKMELDMRTLYSDTCVTARSRNVSISGAILQA